MKHLNEHVEKMSIQKNSMKIEIEVVRKMYVTIKLYNNTSLVAEVQKTLHDFTNTVLTIPTEGWTTIYGEKKYGMVLYMAIKLSMLPMIGEIPMVKWSTIHSMN